jgi:hypothetical protein
LAGFFSLAEGAARFAAAAIDLEFAKRAAIKEACLMVQERAKDLIGHPNPEWPPLAAATIRRKDGVRGQPWRIFCALWAIAKTGEKHG